MDSYQQSLTMNWTEDQTASAEAFWKDVYQREYPRLYNYFLYHFGNRDLALDLTAETFEEAWKSRHKYDQNRAGFATWLFAIGRHRGGKYLRKKQWDIKLTDTFIDDSEEMDTHVQNQLDQQKLRHAITKLPEREKELIALKYGAGMTNRQIASIVQLSESNVGSILHRTIKQLRKEWSEK